MGTREPEPAIHIATPEATDGPAVHALIAACPPLDRNSLYCNLLQCTHFAETCAIARRGGQAVGFLSAYLVPDSPDTLFVWQIAVRTDARRRGLARRMLLDILARPACRGVRRIEATVTAANDGSRALFGALARELGAEETHRPLFTREENFAGTHDTEILISIGPFEPLTHPSLLEQA